MKRNIKELDVDFIGGEKPSEKDFARISEWIKKNKEKQKNRKKHKQVSRKKVSGGNCLPEFSG